MIDFFNLFKRKRHKRLKVYVSLIPAESGGGSNTFSLNIVKWLQINSKNYCLCNNISKADIAIIIAHKGEYENVFTARKKGCYIIHRLDEHVEENEDEYRLNKHNHIKKLNELADITVYQSHFVYNNMHPFLGYPKFTIIHNGAFDDEFYPASAPGNYIGHITWGVGDKKRLDILYNTIKATPEENFLLVGNHEKSSFDFAQLSNVLIVNAIQRKRLLKYLHMMKFLFFPSENDPCPNTVVESLMAGVPVCYNPVGGTVELVKECGTDIDNFQEMRLNWEKYRHRTKQRTDLNFNLVARKYLALYD